MTSDEKNHPRHLPYRSTELTTKSSLLWLGRSCAMKCEYFYTCTSLILEGSSTPRPNVAAVEIYLGSRFACFKEGSLISLRFSSIIVWHIRSRATGSLPTIIPLYFHVHCGL